MPSSSFFLCRIREAQCLLKVFHWQHCGLYQAFCPDPSSHLLLRRLCVWSGGGGRVLSRIKLGWQQEAKSESYLWKRTFPDHYQNVIFADQRLLLCLQVVLLFLQNMNLLLSKTPKADIQNHVLPMLFRAVEADSPQIQVAWQVHSSLDVQMNNWCNNELSKIIMKQIGRPLSGDFRSFFAQSALSGTCVSLPVCRWASVCGCMFMCAKIIILMEKRSWSDNLDCAY